MSGIERTIIDSFKEIKIVKIKREYNTSLKIKFWGKPLERIVELSLVEGELMLTCQAQV